MRTFWFVAGTAAGVYVSGRARRAVEAVTLDGVHDRFTGWFAGAAVLRDEVRQGSHDKESELRERLQLPQRSALPQLPQLPRSRPALDAGPDEQGDELARVRHLRP